MGLALFYISLLTAAGRSHGIGGLWGVLGWLATATFTIAFGYAAFTLHGIWIVPAAAITFFGIITGHGRFYVMQGANPKDPNPEWIETHIILPWYKGDIYKPLYSWLCMGFKGFMVGACIFPYGLPLVLFYPAAYTVSWKYTNSSGVAEYLTGYFSGVVLCITILLH